MEKKNFGKESYLKNMAGRKEVGLRRTTSNLTGVDCGGELCSILDGMKSMCLSTLAMEEE